MDWTGSWMTADDRSDEIKGDWAKLGQNLRLGLVHGLSTRRWEVLLTLFISISQQLSEMRQSIDKTLEITRSRATSLKAVSVPGGGDSLVDEKPPRKKITPWKEGRREEIFKEDGRQAGGQLEEQWIWLGEAATISSLPRLLFLDMPPY